MRDNLSLSKLSVFVVLFCVSSFLYCARVPIKKQFTDNFNFQPDLNDNKKNFNLAKRYFYGYGVEKDFHKSFDYFTKAILSESKTEPLYWIKMKAKLSDKNAICMQGKIYYDGVGVVKDNFVALENFKEAAFKGNLEAVSYIQKMAEQNDNKAQFVLGELFYRGYGVEIDKNTAFTWFKKSLKNGNSQAIDWLTEKSKKDSEASLFLAYLYQKGIFVNKDLSIAVDWFGKSALKGNNQSYLELEKISQKNHENACFILAKCLYQGFGTEKDVEGSFDSFKKSIFKEGSDALLWVKDKVKRDNLDLAYFLGELYNKGNNNINSDKDLALKWYKIAAENGNTKAFDAILTLSVQGDNQALLEAGILLFKGYGVERDFIKGLSLIKEAVENGNEQALEWMQQKQKKNDKNILFALGEVFSSGKGVQKDEDKAISFFERAAKNGSLEAFQKLEQLANKGNSNALFSFGKLLHFGYATEKDHDIAFKVLNQAIASGNDDALFWVRAIVRKETKQSNYLKDLVPKYYSRLKNLKEK